ncbi:placenta-specific protein 1-like [Heterocephalus glaber]|uniref:Placenta-specific protein 1-like n=1 Tax=Heterocephalus glaber TaxID=10181 RepID=A0AAX6S436_HETGA|nr:placenta-specific protein 1-like [Heterocephalus glaber]
MKGSVLLGGSLLLSLLVWKSCELEPVWVICTEIWLRVRLDRYPLLDNLQVQSQELTLGHGCPVSIMLPEYFDFMYHLTSCGIGVYEQPSGIFIATAVTYSPLHLGLPSFYYNITCFLPRNKPLSFQTRKIHHSHNHLEGARQTWLRSGEMEYPGRLLGALSW